MKNCPMKYDTIRYDIILWKYMILFDIFSYMILYDNDMTYCNMRQLWHCGTHREALAARKEEAVKLVKMGRWRLLALDDDFDGWSI